MTCPYCSGEMRPVQRISYEGIHGCRVVQWVRCERCSHATVSSAELQDVYRRDRELAVLASR